MRTILQLAGMETRQFTHTNHRGTHTYTWTGTRSVRWSSLHLQPGLWAGSSCDGCNGICLEFLLSNKPSCDCCNFWVGCTPLLCLPRKILHMKQLEINSCLLQLSVIKLKIHYFKKNIFKNTPRKGFFHVPYEMLHRLRWISKFAFILKQTFQMWVWTYNSIYHVGLKGKIQAQKSKESNQPLK